MKQQYRKSLMGLISASVMMLLFPFTHTNAQTYAEVDYLVMNRLYDFLIDYEKTVSSDAFSRVEFKKYYYSDFVEVYNDIAPDLPEYITFAAYLDELDALKWQNPGIEFFHYNLEIVKHSKGFYFDVVHIRLLKEIVRNDLTARHIDSTNLLSSHLLDFTLIYNKFSNGYQFQILKVEDAKGSLLPDAWHRKVLPDELRLSFGPSFIFFDKIENHFLTNTSSNGFSGKVNINNRFAGGKNFAAYWNIGAGIDYINSSWMLNYDSSNIQNQVDNFGDNYTRRVIASEIEQDLSFLYLNVPIGLSLRLFNPNGFSLTLGGELIPRYLVNSDYNTTSGRLAYSGTYTEIVNGQTYPFHLSNIGSLENNDYDYFVMPATNRNDEVNFEKFGIALGLTIQAGYRVGKYFDVFVAPSWRLGITDLLKIGSEQNYLSIDNWEVNPVIGKENKLSFSNTSIEAGIIFRLNNVVKPFVKETKFKNEERRDQKLNFEEYLVNQIPFNPEEFGKRAKKSVNIEYDWKVDLPVPKMNYAFSKNTGIENRKLAAGKNTIRAPYKGMFLFKPFGYNIANVESFNWFDIHNKLMIDSLNADQIRLGMTYLPELNISVIMKMNDDSHPDVREKIISAYKSKYRSEIEKCVLYFFESHGSNISQIVQEGKSNELCYSCNEIKPSIDAMEKKTSDGSEPIIHFINELRLLLLQDFALERRTINLDFFIGNPRSLINAFNGLQNLREANKLGYETWSDEKDNESVKKELEEISRLFMKNAVDVSQFKNINFFIDYNSDLQTILKDMYYRPIEEWQREEFIRNTHKMLYQYINAGGATDKSIRLRNFEFIKL